MTALHFDVPVGTEDEEPGVRHLAGEEAEQEKRILVGPVEVLEDEGERLGAGGVLDEGRDRVEKPETRLVALERWGSTTSGSRWRISGKTWAMAGAAPGGSAGDGSSWSWIIGASATAPHCAP